MRLQSEVENWFASGRLPEKGRAHFVGIGGAGMSALARILLHRGREVSGSDVQETAATRNLREMGARVSMGHDAANVAGAAAVIISDAIDLDENPEPAAARSQGLPTLRRSQLLGEVLRGKRVIAVTGSHGKSSTTAIIAQILIAAGHDPLAIVGADVPGFQGNVRLGNGDIAVVEACEAYDSFHDIQPALVVLTNLEPEHLDYHKTWENLRKSVTRFIASATEEPHLIFCSDDAGAREVAEEFEGALSYGFDSGIVRGSYRNGVLETEAGSHPLSVIGRHNALNALGAIAAATRIGVSPKEALEKASKAVGCRRRLERIGEEGGILVYDDYAHHPTEIRASISALRETYPNRRLVVVFQPHLYSRTRDQLNEFAPALSAADEVVLTDIYPARERPIPGISSALIAERLEALGVESRYVPSRHLLPREVARSSRPGDVVAGMGAGTIDAFAPDLIKELLRRGAPLRVAVMCGGESAEREVSLLSGGMVADALRRRGYQTEMLDPTELLLGGGGLGRLTGPDRPDIVFLALHGTGAEDGAPQGLLELLHLPYTGSGIAASALAFDKAETKRILETHGIPTPKGVLVDGDIDDFPLPAVVKPNAQGSTIGLTFARTPEELARGVRIALKYDKRALVEELVEGIEISVPVLGEEALPAVEIRPKSGSYDFWSKYAPGETEEIVPARISEEAEKTAKEYALIAHQALGALDVSRTDMIVSGNRIVVMEINTLPGFTATSLLPRSAESVGISYEDLCERILISAMKRYGIRK